MHVMLNFSLSPGPIPSFQCCILSWEWAWGQGYVKVPFLILNMDHETDESIGDVTGVKQKTL